MPTTNTRAIQTGQTLLDLCLWTAGEIDGVFECALSNGIGITDDIYPGSVMIGVAPSPEKIPIVAIFLKCPPASGTPLQDMLPGGIGYMQIENDFKVS